MIARTSRFVPIILPVILIFCFMPVTRAQDSPVFSLENVSTTASTITVSISATNFINISGGNLKILYDCNMAIPSAIVKDTRLKGSCDFNLSEQGVIRIGWYTFPAVNLTDGDVLFKIEFRKVTYGTSELRFDSAFSDMDCQFYDGTHKKLNDYPFDDFYKSGSVSFEHKGVLTTAQTLIANSGAQVIIPVTVTDFTEIGAVSLMLKYDPNVLKFISAENSGGYPGMKIYNPAPGIITVSGTVNYVRGVSLPDGSVLFSVSFIYQGGTTDLVWHDDGTSCEYAGPFSEYVIPDTPPTNYYKNGRVGNCTAPDTPVLLLTQPNCQISTGSIRISSPLDDNYSYSIDGTNFQPSSVFTGLKSGRYHVTVKNSSGCISPATEAFIVEPPEIPSPPLIDVSYAACGEPGNAEIINFNNSYEYVFEPPGPVADDNGTMMNYKAGQTYIVKAYNSHGCESTWSEPFIINENEAPEPVITISYSGNLCEAGCLTLTASEGESYLWSTGETTQSILAMSTGEYSVEVTYLNGCSAVSKPVPVIISHSMETPANKNHVALKVYPNPFRDRVTFEYTSSESASLFMGIYDLTGRLISQSKGEVTGGVVHYEEFIPAAKTGNAFYYKVSIGNTHKTGMLFYLNR